MCVDVDAKIKKIKLSIANSPTNSRNKKPVKRAQAPAAKKKVETPEEQQVCCDYIIMNITTIYI